MITRASRRHWLLVSSASHAAFVQRPELLCAAPVPAPRATGGRQPILRSSPVSNRLR